MARGYCRQQAKLPALALLLPLLFQAVAAKPGEGAGTRSIFRLDVVSRTNGETLGAFRVLDVQLDLEERAVQELLRSLAMVFDDEAAARLWITASPIEGRSPAGPLPVSLALVPAQRNLKKGADPYMALVEATVEEIDAVPWQRNGKVPDDGYREANCHLRSRDPLRRHIRDCVLLSLKRGHFLPFGTDPADGEEDRARQQQPPPPQAAAAAAAAATSGKEEEVAGKKDGGGKEEETPATTDPRRPTTKEEEESKYRIEDAEDAGAGQSQLQDRPPAQQPAPPARQPAPEQKPTPPTGDAALELEEGLIADGEVAPQPSTSSRPPAAAELGEEENTRAPSGRAETATEEKKTATQEKKTPVGEGEEPAARAVVGKKPRKSAHSSNFWPGEDSDEEIIQMLSSLHGVRREVKEEPAAKPQPGSGKVPPIKQRASGGSNKSKPPGSKVRIETEAAPPRSPWTVATLACLFLAVGCVVTAAAAGCHLSGGKLEELGKVVSGQTHFCHAARKHHVLRKTHQR